MILNCFVTYFYTLLAGPHIPSSYPCGREGKGSISGRQIRSRGVREAEMIPLSYFWASSIISGCVPFHRRGYRGLPLVKNQASSVYSGDFSFIRCKHPIKNFMFRSRINSAECHLYGVLHGPLIPSRSPLRIIQASINIERCGSCCMQGTRRTWIRAPGSPRSSKTRKMFPEHKRGQSKHWCLFLSWRINEGFIRDIDQLDLGGEMVMMRRAEVVPLTMGVEAKPRLCIVWFR